MVFTNRQKDRALGAILGGALAEAMVLHYNDSLQKHKDFEQDPVHDLETDLDPTPEKLVWGKNTDLSIEILKVLADGKSLTSTKTQKHLSSSWENLAESKNDISERANNICLAVTVATTLGFLSPSAVPSLSNAVQQLSELASTDQLCAESATLLAQTIRKQIIYKRADVVSALDYLPTQRRREWLGYVSAALRDYARYTDFVSSPKNIVSVVKSCIKLFSDGISMFDDSEQVSFIVFEETLIRLMYQCEDKADVAFLVGSMLGAEFGYSSLMTSWVESLHSETGQTINDLKQLVSKILDSEYEHDLVDSSIEKMLEMASIGAVARFYNTAVVYDFRSAAEVEEWINTTTAKANSLANFKVLNVSGIGDFDLKQDPLGLISDMHIHLIKDKHEYDSVCQNIPEQQDWDIFFHPSISPLSWYDAYFSPKHKPEIWLSYDGSKLSTFNTRFSFKYSDFTDVLEVHDPTKPFPDYSWLLIMKEGSDFAIPVPANYGTLDVTTDHDGASAGVTGNSLPIVLDYLETRAKFYADWGAWLDEEQPLSDKELDTGVALAEQVTAELIETDTKKRRALEERDEE